MKRMKKFASLALALVMTLAMMAPVFAEGTNTTGTITINNATIGKDYSIYKIFDATYDTTQTPALASYTIKSDNAWYTLVEQAPDVFTLTEVIAEPGTFNVAVADGADVIAWLNKEEIQNNLPEATASQKAKTVEVTFTGVDFGYYLVKSSLNGGGTLTVDNATPNAEVIDKNQEPGNLVKTATNGVTVDGDIKSAQIGDEVNFQITYTATNYDGEKKIVEYYVDDDMPNGFDLVEDSIAVKVGDEILTLTDDYTIDYGTEDTDDFKVTIPWVGTDSDKTSLYDSPTTITVTYKATINANAVIDGAGNTNTAKITHKNDGKDTPETPDPIKDTGSETVFTYALAIKKVNKGGQPLEGVKFALTDKDGDPVNVTFKDGVYTVDATAISNKVITDSEGLIIVKGVDHVKYLLTETETLNGYNLLTTPVEVTPVKTGKTTTTETKYIDENGNVVNTETDVKVEIVDTPVAVTAVVVVNFTGSLLPSTGGIGTTIFYVVGGILVAGAAILLVTRKRVEEQ